MRVAVIGGVTSTEVLISRLAFHGCSDVAVWGYQPQSTERVSSWTNLAAIAISHGFRFESFERVDQCRVSLTAFEPTILFAVGLSQLIPPDLLSIPSVGNVGFHPTALPEGRGRAPIAWLVLEKRHGAATFFGLRDGIDDGPIYVQEPFLVTDEDDAHSVMEKVLAAEGRALDRWLPELLAIGELHGQEQDHAQATWYGRRAPSDGWIDWHANREDVVRLIRASTRPHPGSFTVIGDVLVTVWAAETLERRVRGVIGRIIDVGESGFTVQASDGLVRVTSWQSEPHWTPRVGIRCGYYADQEIMHLRARCDRLESAVERLLAKLSGDKGTSAH